MKNLQSVEISGVLAGKIWMPSCYAWKDFSVKFTPDDRPFTREWHGLPDALDHITNDGDFQSAGIVEACIKVTWQEDNKRSTVLRNELNLDAKLLQDFKADPEDVDAYFFGGVEE